ncbi:MAG TPA: hypothetical protein PKA02_01460 [Candidatus Saccharibacteria bacterium]|nr:hypothetical protein [Candidatus Saccharibacteria bacterium]
MKQSPESAQKQQEKEPLSKRFVRIAGGIALLGVGFNLIRNIFSPKQ